MMRWDIATRPQRCANMACRAFIAVGMPIVAHPSDTAWCEACGRRHAPELVPPPTFDQEVWRVEAGL